jgi:phosphoserine phosphatase RsbU/P
VAEPGGGRLLVVDDNRLNRMMLGRHLAQQGHNVAYAENGREALERLRAEPFEMMLLDIEMPEVDGYEVLRQVIADPELRNVAVIVTSALEEMDSIVRCIQMGAEDYLIKPVNEILLKARIDASLEKKRLRDLQTEMLSRMESELELARKTQQSILPDVLPEQSGYDFGALMIPARVVGGDFYEFIPHPDQRLGIVIGDVSDKGLPAALFMALTYSLVRAEATRTTSPVQVLKSVNRHLLNMNASNMFVTLLYGCLDFESGELVYARAGHPLPMILGPECEKIEIPSQPGQPLGILEEPLLDLQTTILPPGGLVCLFTDGISEAADEHGTEFGLERLEKTLRSQTGATAQADCARLWDAVQDHRGGLAVQDDFAAVIIKRI